ncbi:MAG: hypothetical protein PHV18_13510 [Lachnospiraceae bacterium]|nr:hypothetical protein [Lachnospiraceae bacterium]
MNYKKLWTDMHSNIHHDQMEALPLWFEQIKKEMDFWPIAYYPFYMRPTECGLAVEDRYDDALIEKDWEGIKAFTRKANEEGFPMFMGYEWQGAGLDGDHNVFFLADEGEQKHPMRYQELAEEFKGQAVIGIPHHLAYQPGSRGKNWDTHDEQFSPFAEIYSSHGSSENDDGPLTMNRHVHMGPRTGETTYEKGLDRGYKVGVIAAGDNHSVPGVFEHGSMCVLAENPTKEAIWDAFVNRRTYGVSQSRIEVDYTVNDVPMGGEVKTDGEVDVEFHVKGTAAVDRIEILRDNIVEEMVIHSGTWEREPLQGVIRFKFRLELGWGPDVRVYKDQWMKHWAGSLKVDGRLLGVEKCWNNYGQDITRLDDDRCDFSMTTYQSTATGKWMGPSNVTTEGFIFEVEADADSTLLLTIDGKEYPLAVRELLDSSRVVALWDEVRELTRQTWGDVTHYRDDPWWHNAYKFRVGKAYPEASYEVHYHKKLRMERDGNLRLRIWQKNGDAAWTSPVFVTAAK